MDKFRAHFQIRPGLREVREYHWESKHYPRSEFAAIMESIADEEGIMFLHYEDAEVQP